LEIPEPIIDSVPELVQSHEVIQIGGYVENLSNEPVVETKEIILSSNIKNIKNITPKNITPKNIQIQLERTPNLAQVRPETVPLVSINSVANNPFIRNIKSKNFIKNKYIGMDKNNSFYKKKYQENSANYNSVSDGVNKDVSVISQITKVSVVPSLISEAQISTLTRSKNQIILDGESDDDEKEEVIDI
jgi:hypothetical protein